MHPRQSRCARWLVRVVPVVLFPALAAAQSTGTVRGRVGDAASGAPIPGAQVTIQGTPLGSIADNGGGYVIPNVPAGSHVLIARRIGFAADSQRITVTEGGTASADFSLRSAAVSLEQVVVTGTATPTQIRALGTNVPAVNAEEIQKSQALTVDAALQGKIPGAQITQNSGNPGGGGISVRLRGTSSIVSGSEPLYIVDGVIVDNSSDALVDLGARSNVQNRLADLDPNDIERIEIVRGAAAAALYGSRANNGVVQIFTKRGRSGATRFTTQTRYTGEQLYKKLDLNMAPKDQAGNAVTRHDFQDLIFQGGSQIEQYLSAEGGNAQTTWYVGGSYNGEDGIMKGSSSQRRSARVNLGQELFPTLRLNVGANYVNTHNQFQPNGEQTTGIITALLFAPTSFDFRPVNGVYPTPPLGGSFANPFAVIDLWNAPQDIHRFIGSANAQWTPYANSSLQYTIGYDGYQMQADEFIPRGTLGSEPTGYITSVIRDSRILNNDLVGSYTLKGMGRFELTTSAGLNYTTQRIGTTTGVARDLIPTGELLNAGAIPAVSQSRFDLATLGYYAQEQANWRDVLYLTGAVRRDAASTFGANERWQTYPKASLSYVISDESYFKNSFLARPFNSLRFRAALGFAGNQPSLANAYARYDTYVKTVNSGHVGVVNSVTLGNPDLKPERQREFEGGFDAEFMNRRIGLEATIYDKKVTDLLLFRPLPASTGFSQKFDNIGAMQNRGVELGLNTTNIDRPGFNWRSTITYSRNRNRITHLSVSPFTLGYANRVQEGEEVGAFYAEIPQKVASCSFYTALAAGQLLPFSTLNGCRDSLDAAGLIVRSPTGVTVTLPDGRRVDYRSLHNGIVGGPAPKWMGSFLNEMGIGRHVQLRVLLDGTFGNDILNFTHRTLDTFSNSKDIENEINGKGTPGYARSQRFYFGKYLEDGSFVKLREISATYNFGTSLARHVRARDLALTVAGRNLYTWTDYSGFDPELNLFGQATVERGNDFGTYPIPRTLSVTLRATF